MNIEVVREALRHRMQQYREKPFPELQQLLDAKHTDAFLLEAEVATYRCKIEVMWADFQDGYITVFGTAHRPRNSMSRLFYWRPLVTETFTMSPENTIIDEESN